MSLVTPPLSDNISKQLYGLTVGGEAVGFETITVNSTTLAKLAIPLLAAWKDKILYCRIMLEADATVADANKVIRFIQSSNIGSNAQNVTVSNLKQSGFMMADKGVITVNGLLNLQQFRCIGLETGKTHKLLVEYYG